MDPEATGNFVDTLLNFGMEFVEDGIAQDIFLNKNVYQRW